jgi:outer membrane protein TolC
MFLISVAQAKLTPSEIVKLVSNNNTKVKLARLDLELARAEKGASQKDEDWNVGLATFFENDEMNNNSSLDLTKVTEKTLGFSIGVTKELSYGTKVDLSYQSLRITSDSLNAISPKRHQGASKISITQPLLKGNSPFVNNDKKMKAPFKIKRYENRLANVIEKEVLKTINIGIDILEKKEELKIKEQSLSYYINLEKYNQKSLKNGNKSKADYLDAKAKLLREKSLIRQNKSKIIILEYKFFKQITSANKKDSININKVNEIDFTEIENIKDRSSAGEDTKINEKLWQIEEDRVSLKGAINQLLPKLDLKLEYSSSGLNNKYNDSLSQVLRSDFPELVVGFNFTWSFGSNTALGRAGKARWLLKRREFELKKLKNEEQKNWSESIANLNEIDSLEEQALGRQKNEEQKLKIKRKMYRQGMISYIDLGKVLADYEDFNIGLLRSKVRRLREHVLLRSYLRKFR